MQALLRKAQEEQMQQAAKDLAARQKDIQNKPAVRLRDAAEEFQVEIAGR